MKHVSWIITFPITVLVVVFAVVNREFVTVDLWLLKLSLPLFLLVLGSALVGFLVGALVMWWSAGRQRQRLRRLRGEVERLARRNRSLEQAGQPAAATRGLDDRSGLPAAAAPLPARPAPDRPAV